MIKTIDNDTVKKLIDLYEEDEVARRLFDWFSARQKDATETSVDRAAWMTRSQSHEIVRVFRELEAAGCGQLILGRKGWKTRFRWNYSVRSLSEAARGHTAKLDNIDVNNVEPEEDMQDSVEITDTTKHTHTMQLRSDVTVSIELPSDFTLREAERMAQWLRSIPFE